MIENAVKRLQVLALSCAEIKHAPDYPTEDAAVLPFAVAHLSSGTASPDNKTTLRFLPIVNVDFHFSRVNLANAYRQASAVALEYSAKLGGDPTLAGAVDTIVFPVTFDVAAAEWDRVTTLMLRFSIPLKTLENMQ
jgi:hypothetical protein